MYKALLTAYIDTSGEFSIHHEEDIQIKHMAQSILEIIHGLETTATSTGFYLKRWEDVIEIMIYKEPGNILLEKLRVIHLFEADFNLIIGLLFGRRSMFDQTQNNHLHPGQYGKPGGECQDAALSKQLQYHISTYTRTPLGSFESDAAACFDRIVMAFALSCFLVWGATLANLCTWERTIYNIEHRIKTGYGVSKGKYRYSNLNPIIGPGQGSGGAMAAYATITTPLLMAMDRLANGAEYSSPDESFNYNVKAQMYVDDNTNYYNEFKRSLQNKIPNRELAEKLQHDAQTWERCLWTSGGLLKLEKCLFYTMQWKFDKNGLPILTHENELPNIKITSGNTSVKLKIRQNNYDTAHKTLGNRMDPSLQMRTALQK